MFGALRILPLLALLVGAMTLVACSGEADSREERNTYVRALNVAQQEFATNASRVSTQGKVASLGQYRRTLGRFEDTIETFATKLKEIEVPGVVKAEHAQLISALTRFGTDFRQVTGALNNPNARALSDAKDTIASATQRANARIEAAAAAIDSKLRDT